MEYKLLGISGLILIILLLTWLKDGENMNPPLKRRGYENERLVEQKKDNEEIEKIYMETETNDNG